MNPIRFTLEIILHLLCLILEAEAIFDGSRFSICYGTKELYFDSFVLLGTWHADLGRAVTTSTVLIGRGEMHDAHPPVACACPLSPQQNVVPGNGGVALTSDG